MNYLVLRITPSVGRKLSRFYTSNREIAAKTELAISSSTSSSSAVFVLPRVQKSELQSNINSST